MSHSFATPNLHINFLVNLRFGLRLLQSSSLRQKVNGTPQGSRHQPLSSEVGHPEEESIHCLQANGTGIIEATNIGLLEALASSLTHEAHSTWSLSLEADLTLLPVAAGGSAVALTDLPAEDALLGPAHPAA